MLFKFYYLKEGTRVFDRTELLTFFQANANVTMEKKEPIGFSPTTTRF